jgi:hypothetical protein
MVTAPLDLEGDQDGRHERGHELERRVVVARPPLAEVAGGPIVADDAEGGHDGDDRESDRQERKREGERARRWGAGVSELGQLPPPARQT